MSKHRPIDDPMPTGQLVVGGDHGLPNRGATAGVTDTYGADLSGDAINRTGGMGNAAKSDPWAKTEHAPSDSKPMPKGGTVYSEDTP